MPTGTTPFRDRSLSGELRRHLATTTPDVREERPDTPPALAQLVRELLAKHPEDRAVSAEAIVWQLLTVVRRL